MPSPFFFFEIVKKNDLENLQKRTRIAFCSVSEENFDGLESVSSLIRIEF